MAKKTGPKCQDGLTPSEALTSAILKLWLKDLRSGQAADWSDFAEAAAWPMGVDAAEIRLLL